MLLYESHRLTVRDVFEAIFRQRWLVALVFFLTIIPIGVATFLAPKVYKASSKVLVRRDDRPGSLYQNYSRLSQDEEIRTEVEIATSRPVLEQVLLNEGLYETKQNGINLSAADDRESLIRDPFTQLSRHRAGEPESDHMTDIPSGRRDHEMDEAMIRLRRKMLVEAIKGSNVIEIGYEDENPVRAARIANALANAYAAHNALVHGSEESEEFLAERVRDTKMLLDSLESVLQDYRVDHGLVAYDKQESIMLERFKSLENQQASKREQLVMLTGKIERLRRFQEAAGNFPIPTSEMDRHPAVRRLYNKLVDLRIEKNTLKEKFHADHLLVVDITKNIEKVEQQLQAEIGRLTRLEEGHAEALSFEIEVLANLQREMRTEMRQLPQKQRELNDLNLAIENARKVYSMLVIRLEEMKVETATDQRLSRVAILSPAGIPLEPAGPKTARNLFLGVIFGALLSIAAALIREFYDRSFKSPDELKSTMEVPVFASISQHNEEKTEQAPGIVNSRKMTNSGNTGSVVSTKRFTEFPFYMQEGGSSNSLREPETALAFPDEDFGPVDVFDNANSAVSPGQMQTPPFRGKTLPEHEVEKLKHEILMMRRSQDTQIIGFASAQCQEGNSTVLANLGLLLSETDLSVLLVDMNTKNPSLAKMFYLDDKPGLVELMRKECKTEEVIQEIGSSRLLFLPLGDLRKNAWFDCATAARFVRSTFRKSRTYDLILIDLPPMSESNQTLHAAQKTDGLIQVVQSERTKSATLQALKHEINRLGVHLLGTVLNCRKDYLPKFIGSRL